MSRNYGKKLMPGRNTKKLNQNSSRPDDMLYMAPHLLDSEVEPFCRRVSEFGKIIEGLCSIEETDQKQAIRRADMFLFGGEGDRSFDPAPPITEQEKNQVTEVGDGPKPKIAMEPGDGDEPKDKIAPELSECGEELKPEFVTEYEKGTVPKVVAEKLDESEDNQDKNTSAPIHKAEVLIEDCSDDEDCQPKATTSAYEAEQLGNGKTGDNASNSMQSAEQGIIDLLILPGQAEEDQKQQNDRMKRKEMSDIHRKKGNIAFRMMEYADAVSNYTRAIELIPEDSFMYMNRAQAYLRAKLPAFALEDLEQAVEMNPKSLKAHLLQSRAYFNLSQPDKAKEFLEYVKKRFSENLGMIQAFEKDLFDMKMERHLETREEARQREEIQKMSRIPMLSDLEEKWQKLGRHELLEVECLK